MARKLLCKHCNTTLEGLAKEYNELFESVEGVSKERFTCDDCGDKIKQGDTCFAAVLLPYRSHPNYHYQKPSVWADKFMTPVIEPISK